MRTSRQCCSSVPAGRILARCIRCSLDRHQIQTWCHYDTQLTRAQHISYMLSLMFWKQVQRNIDAGKTRLQQRAGVSFSLLDTRSARRSTQTIYSLNAHTPCNARSSLLLQSAAPRPLCRNNHIVTQVTRNISVSSRHSRALGAR